MTILDFKREVYIYAFGKAVVLKTKNPLVVSGFCGTSSTTIKQNQKILISIFKGLFKIKLIKSMLYENSVFIQLGLDCIYLDFTVQIPYRFIIFALLKINYYGNNQFSVSFNKRRS